MKKTPEPPPLTPEEIEDLFGMADIDRKNFESDWKAQEVANQNAQDAMLVAKIDILLSVLESQFVEDIEKGFARTKLAELIKKL